MAKGKALQPHTDPGHPAVVPASYVQPHPHQQKSLQKAYCYALVGFLGTHHFYLKRPKFGVLYLFTFGLCGIGWFLDFCRMPLIVQQANRQLANPEAYKKRKNLLDAYIVWMPLGLLGMFLLTSLN